MLFWRSPVVVLLIQKYPHFCHNRGMKTLVLGISGGIAAYKSAELVRLARQAGWDVRVVMTESAKQFITPMTLQALSGHSVHDSLWDVAAEAAMGHIQLARLADQVLIAPASADVIARLAHGLANDLLTTLCLATQAPIAVAPAMNQQMWQAQATQHNIEILRQRGVAIWGPAEGLQACGEEGFGRMMEPTDLVHKLAGATSHGVLAGKRVLITAGPTQEPIDPMRFISNQSTGQLGYAIAEHARRQGAQVQLISGPVTLSVPQGVACERVTTALEMQAKVREHVKEADIFIACAAVGDYRAEAVSTQKIKKSADTFLLKLQRNPDILAEVASLSPRTFTVGFAAETEDLLSYAERKRQEKRLDLICANWLLQPSDRHTLYILDGTQTIPLGPASKTVIAQQLIAHIAAAYHGKCTTKNSKS